MTKLRDDISKKFAILRGKDPKKVHVIYFFSVKTKIVWIQAGTRLVWAVVEHSVLGDGRSNPVW